MRRLSVSETETLLATLQKRSGLDKRSFDRVRRSVESKIKAVASFGKKAKEKKQQKQNKYFVDPSHTIEMHLFSLVFNNPDRPIKIIDQAFREYVEDKGFWKTLDDFAVKQEIQKEASRSFRVAAKNQIKYQGSPGFVDSALKYAATELYQCDAIERTHLRAFKNGTVNLKTGAISPHNPEDYLTSYIPYDYQPNSECPDSMKGYIDSSMGMQALDSVRAGINMALDPTAPNKFIHIVGPSGSGKGVLGKLISKMFGQESVMTDNDFKKLGGADQRHQYLQGCSLFYIDDLADQHIGDEIGSFYTLVERTPISGRSLFSSKAYRTIFNTRYVVCSTGPISTKSSASKGLIRRVFPLPTKHLEVKPDPTIELRLQEDIALIISWALAMPKELRNEILMNPAQYNESTAIYLSDSDLGTNSVKSFVDSCLKPIKPTEAGGVDEISIGLVYDQYKAYALATGLKSLGKPVFTSQLKQVLPAHFIPRKSVKDGTKVRKEPSRWVFFELDTRVFDKIYTESGEYWKIQTEQLKEGNLDLFEDWAEKYKQFHPYPDTISMANVDKPTQNELAASDKSLPLEHETAVERVSAKSNLTDDDTEDC